MECRRKPQSNVLMTKRACLRHAFLPIRCLLYTFLMHIKYNPHVQLQTKMLCPRYPYRDLFLKSNGICTASFIIIIILFAILKYRVLSTPFFWDELGVYGNMSFQLADNGLSLHPKAIDQWLSHGHPLLYPCIISIGCNWFGTSVFVAHLGNLVISVALVVSVFLHSSCLENRFLGLLSTSILMSQPIFFAQSAMVLPEIALSLALWWCTWTYFRQKLIPYVIAGSAAVLIKEPAVVWICALFTYDFLFGRNRFSLRSMQWILPMIVFIVFLLVQKRTWGWYLFPYHSNSIDFTPGEVVSKLWLYLKFLFWEQGRGLVAFTIFLGCFLITTKPKLLQNYWRKARKLFFSIGFTACISYLLFSSLTFFLWRYILPLLPYISILAAICIYRLAHDRKVYLAFVLFLGCTLLPISYSSSNHFDYDSDMSYIRAIDAEKKALQYMISNGIYQQDKFSVNMPLNYAIIDKRFGYLPDSVPSYGSNQISEKTIFAVALTPGTSLENPKNLPLELTFEQYFYDIKMSIYRVIHDSLTIE